MAVIARTAASLALVLLLAACQRDPTLPALSSDAVILAFGDSLTYGTGADRGQSYPDVLAELTGRQVINAGVPGEVTAQGRERLPAMLDKYQPELLILLHGGNDLLRRHDPQQAADNIRAMVREARDRGYSVLLVGVPRPGLWLESAAFYEDVAREFTIPLEADIVAVVEGDAELKSDPI
ncbi:MAG: GDSL-type esterase/lipase family protein, partial [Pseudomonadota bacterium]|nr:GDSL-type esterase/lipase family protein [Pseudomonadota bacterium]